LAQISHDAGVPEDLEGCHTMFVGGYVVDGHVPVTVVKKLLTERPAIAGITLPGMPMGSPGMGGEKAGTFHRLCGYQRRQVAQRLCGGMSRT